MKLNVNKIANPLFHLTIFFQLLTYLANAQAPQLPSGFESLTNKNGLSQGHITAIFQDSRGFLWFGTRDGLNRYDGIRFQVFRHDPFDAATISNNFIVKIIEDHLGNLWISTSKGLNRFDPKQETFIRFFDNPDQGPKLIQKYARFLPILEPGLSGDQVNLWIGTFNGLFQMEIFHRTSQKEIMGENVGGNRKVQWRISGFYHDPLDSLSLPDNIIYSLWVGPSGMLWVLTSKGIFITKAKPAPGKPRRFRPLYLAESDYAGLSNGVYYRVAASKDGSLWLATKNQLVHFRSNSRISTYNFPYSPPNRNIFSPISSIFILPDGRLLMNRRGKGLAFDPVQERFQTTAEAFNVQKENLKHARNFFLDRGGILWLGTAGFGALKYDRKKERFRTVNKSHVLSDPPKVSYVSGFYEDHTGAAIVKFGSKLYRHDPTSNTLSPYSLPIPFEVKEFRNMIRKAGGKTLFLQGRNEVWRYHPEQPQSMKISPQMHNQALIKSVKRALLEDHGGNICFIAEAEKKASNGAPEKYYILYRWHNETESLVSTALNLPVESVQSRKKSQFFSGVQDQLNRYWFIFGNELAQINLVQINPETGETKVYRNAPDNPYSLNQNKLKSIYLDPLQPGRYLWIGTDGGGLNRFDMQNETAIHYQESDGLPNHVVYGILSDSRGNLWLSTNRGLSNAIVDKETREITVFRNFYQQDGLQDEEFNTLAYFKNEKGALYFGGIYGFNWFHPDSIHDNPYRPPVVITGLELNHKRISHKDASSPLPRHISTLETLTLPYHENVITLEFAALDYAIPEKNQYSYKLENFDRDWSTPGFEPRAVYTNLDPGEYLFRVKGSNSDGVWNEEGAALKLIITPPWWQTWWAYLLYALLIMAALITAIRYRERALRRYTDELESAVQQRTDTIAQQAEELREMNLLKSRFFANISHEFRTPLTLILGQIESVLPEMQKARLKNKLQMASRNANQLQRLINQLLDLSKFDARQMVLKAAGQNIVPLLRQLTGAFESLAQQWKIQLEFESK